VVRGQRLLHARAAPEPRQRRVGVLLGLRPALRRLRVTSL
jgi:hypothetical protein